MEEPKPAQKERTAKQLERQEKCFNLSIEQSKSTREIALAMKMSKTTVSDDIRAELLRRHTENASRREYETTRAVAFYERMIALALTFEPDEENEEIDKEDRIKRIPDRSINTAIKARERIDKLFGLEGPDNAQQLMKIIVENAIRERECQQ
jgi:hypothetical protein